jgi:hypothetical protein
MASTDGAAGGGYQPKTDYNRTGATDTGGTYAGATLSAPTVTGTLGTNTGLTPTAAVVLTAAQSGTDVYLNASAGFAITLPAVAAGLRFRFTVAAAFATTNFTVITPGLVDIIQGGAKVLNSDVPAENEDTISFVATAEKVGDYVSLWSDGTSWFVDGRGAATGSITFTTAG